MSIGEFNGRKERARAELDKKVQEFLDSGRQIKRIPFGVSGMKEPPKFYELPAVELRYA